MGWVLVFGLALAAFAALVLVFKAPRKGWEAIGAALLLGIAGFAWQARPAQPGAPKQAVEAERKDATALVAARQELAKASGQPPNSWMVIADALARNGDFGDAAGVVLGAVEKNPDNADAWLSLANNLVGHADGVLTPASRYAYDRAIQADPQHPGPAFFLGLALAGEGKLDEGRALWADLLARAPKDAPWRADLTERLARLDAFIAAQTANPGQPR